MVLTLCYIYAAFPHAYHARQPDKLEYTSRDYTSPPNPQAFPHDAPRVAVAVVGTFIVGIAAGVALKELGVDAAEFEKMLAKALPKAAAAAAAVAGEKAE